MTYISCYRNQDGMAVVIAPAGARTPSKGGNVERKECRFKELFYVESFKIKPTLFNNGRKMNIPTAYLFSWKSAVC